MPAPVTQRLPLLQEFRGQSLGVGAATGRPGRVSAQSQPDPAQVGLFRAHIWSWGSAQRAGPVQES